MSLILAGTVRVAPDQVATLAPHATAMMTATRLEDGCLAYAFSEDLADPGLIHVFEIWRDESALAAHAGAPHMKIWRAASAAAGVADRRLAVYQIASERPL